MKDFTNEDIIRLVPEGGIRYHIYTHRGEPINQALLQTRLELENAKRRLSILRSACGYVENGSNQTVKLFQDDATKAWVMESDAPDSWNPKRMRAFAEPGSMEQVIDVFGEKYKDSLNA